MFVRIDQIDHPLLDPYRNLRTTNLTRLSGQFIAESRPLVARLLESSLATESILLDEAFVDEARSWIPDSVPVLVISSPMVRELIGFHFHRGYLACGRRPRFLPVESVKFSNSRTWTGVALNGVQDPENMGSILRTCSALGIQDIFIGPNCVDPFARRVLRVSMGNAFKLNFYDFSDSIPALLWFRSRSIESIAACLSEESEELCQFRRKQNAILLLGNEAHGLPAEILQHTDRKLKIAMDLSTDSLNVSVAAGIILHNLCRIY